MDISVCICTLNPRRDYLKRAVDALRCQTLPMTKWELLLIDNGSDEPVLGWLDLGWHPNARFVLEPTLGLTPARLCGIANSKADLLVFVDDDTILNPTYLREALRIRDQHTMLGAWSGQMYPEFECTPPEWTREFWHLLTIRSLDEDRWSNLVEPPVTIPCGAGMCVRRNVAEAYQRLVLADARRQGMDRKGQTLTGSGDTDLALCAHDLGLGTGLFKALELVHLISAYRLEESHLLRLTEFTRYSEVVLKGLRGYRPNAVLLRWRRRTLGNLWRRLTLSSRKRKFVEASLRGYWKGVAELSTWQNIEAVDKNASEPGGM